MSSYAKYKDLGNGGDSSNNVTGNSVPQMQPNQQMTGIGNPSPPSGHPEVVEIQSLEHKKHFINTHKVCVVKIHAEWCQPCKAIAPRYAQMAQKYNRPGVCILVAENADLNLSNVRGVPTHQFFKNGQYINQDVVGADIAAVEKKLMELLNTP
jgi:thiol-disulfide isomerase/thioredoxin